MKYFHNRNLPTNLDAPSTVQELRERLLNILIVSTASFGLVLYLLAARLALQNGLVAFAGLYTAIYIWLLAIAAPRFLPYSIRLGSWLFLILLLGAINLDVSGLNVNAGIFFVCFVVFSALFYDIRGGLIAFILSALAISIFGILEITNLRQPPLEPFHTEVTPWVIGFVVFSLMTFSMLISIANLLQGLQKNLENSFALTDELKRTNITLRESEERYRILLEMSPDMVALLGLDGAIQTINVSGAALFGYVSPGDVIGKNYQMFFAVDERGLLAEQFQRGLKPDYIFRDAVRRATKKDGTLFWAEFSGSTLSDDSGKVESVLVVGKDVTARKDAEQELIKSRERLHAEILERTSQLNAANERLSEFVLHSPAIIYAGRIENGRFKGHFISENVRRELGYAVEDFANNQAFFGQHVHPDDYDRLVAITNAGPNESGTVIAEYRFLHADGKYRWLRDISRVVQPFPDAPPELIGSLLDITGRKLAEAALEESESRYRTLIELSPVATTVYQDGQLVYLNQAALQTIGLATIQDIVGRSAFEYIHPDYHRLVKARITNMIDRGVGAPPVEMKFLKFDGTIIDVESQSAPITYNGKPSMLVVFQNITERKRMEAELRKTRDQLEAMLNALPDLLFEVDGDGRIFDFRSARHDLLYGSPETFLGKTMREVLPHEAGQIIDHAIAEAAVTGMHRGASYSLELSGETHWFELSIAAKGDLGLQGTRFIMLVHDITERELANQALRESEQRFSTIFNISPVGIAISSLSDGRITNANRVFIEYSGYTLNELIGRSALDLGLWAAPGERQKMVAQLKNAGSIRQIEWKLRSKSGKVEDFLFSADIIDLNNEKQTLGVIQNISRIKQAEKEIREIGEIQRVILDAVDASIVMFDRDYKVLLINEVGAKRIGKRIEEIIGNPIFKFFPPDVAEKRNIEGEKVFQTARPAHFMDFRGGIWFENSIYPILNAAGEVDRVVVYARDVTEHKELEQKLIQANTELEARVNERTAELKASHALLHAHAQRIVTSLENERRRISLELHNEAGQLMIGMRFGLEKVRNEIPTNLRKQRRQINEAMAAADKVVERLRTVSYSLRPPLIDIMGIDSALKAICNEVHHQASIKAAYSSSNLPELPNAFSISIYRFVQETLANVVKHAHASAVEVSADFLDEEIVVAVKDNGIGFDPARLVKGIGIESIEERFNLLGGRLMIEGSIGGGSIFTATLPLKTGHAVSDDRGV